MTYYLNFFAGITRKVSNRVMQICTELHQQHDADHLYFLLSSPGGQVRAGITLYNFLESLPIQVTMHNTGTIDSIATAIFMAGGERYACPSSSFLFHGVQTNFHKGMSLTANKMREHLSNLEGDQLKISKVIAENCEITEAEIHELFAQGESKNLDFALTKEVIDEVRLPDIPTDARIVHINSASN